MSKTKSEIISYLETMSLIVIGLFLVTLPIIFLTITSDAFVLPKQMFLTVAIAILLVLYGLKIIIEGKLKLRLSPFDLPVILFTLVTFTSVILSRNGYDGLINFVPLFFLVLLYFGIIHFVRGEKNLLFILASLIGGAVLSSLITIFSFLKIYPLQLEYTKIEYFTTFGSLLDQGIYLALMLPMAGYLIYAFLKGRSADSPFSKPQKGKNSPVVIGFGISFAIILTALSITLFFLFTSQRPLILPFDTGIQTAFAAISQDEGRIFQSMLFGSGLGTFLTDFTRFKTAAYNANPTLWSFIFFRSSSWVLELLATTGILGVASFFFLVFKIIKSKMFFLPLVVTIIAAFFLPFSFTLIALLFILLAIFSVVLIHNDPEKYSEFDFYLVGLKKGLFAARPDGERIHQTESEKRFSRGLPVVFLIVLLAIVGLPLFFAYNFFRSDITFQRSLIAASQNDGRSTYDLQAEAIEIFKYRDIYYRAFSQTNLALANNLASTQQQENQGASPSAQVQQTITTLIQQSINNGRNAVTVSPMTAFNWNNLSSIYRALIGFGQNADQFTVLTAQQALALDPNNPQQYVELGGIYFQLGDYDEAIRQFRTAINLKQDYANAYYNAGHAYEAKGDLQTALSIYQTVRTIVQKNEANLKQIDSEIKALSDKIGEGAGSSPSAQVEPSEQEEDLNVNEQATLPERDPQIEVPGPTPFSQPRVTPAAQQ